MRKIVMGVAAGAIGLGALFAARGKDTAKPADKGWARAARVAENLDHPLGVAVDGEFVYFVTGGFVKAENAVRRVPATGGPVQLLAKFDWLVAGPLAVDADSVYLTSEVDGLVVRVPKAGGSPTVLARVPGPTQVALDGTHVYFSTFAKQPEGGTVQRVPKAGGAPEVLARGFAGIGALALDESDLYFRSNQGMIKLPKGGGQPTVLLARTESQNISGACVDATHVYFNLETATLGKYAVARIAKTGGAPETIGPVANSTAHLALSGSHVYFFRAVSMLADALAKVPKTGGQPETVDGAGYHTAYLTVSGGDVYFTDVATLYRVPK